ncbi:septum site-determining protein MinC [Paracoccus sp. WLY502]|uniref:septum site-determining protein MinC n=1 Tax=Paracoccus yibinensis TaxID=3068891 RepID=UPI002796E100|nr:septum site-determining protein MinC [Paracoccus sp. WLY502]MDQ1901596.1 septum site-determining protein MinC [Paracoccus sp. WLY502]
MFDVSDGYARARPVAPPAKTAAFQVRGRFLTVLTLRIDSGIADDRFHAQLEEQLGRTPQFFSGAPVVLDLGQAPGLHDTSRIRTLVDKLRQQELQVFGVQNAAGFDPAALRDLGLIAVNTGRDAPLPRQSDPVQAAAPPRPAETKVIRSPVRSGQMIVAEQGDLTVIGSVASGAELIAAGNIHVYGILRGRAMAGCHGNENAHIFCQSLDAELVAIAGLYQTSESLDDAARQRCTHIYLENEKLRMEVIA